MTGLCCRCREGLRDLMWVCCRCGVGFGGFCGVERAESVVVTVFDGVGMGCVVGVVRVLGIWAWEW